MPNVTDLPCEIIASMFGKFDDIVCLSNSLLVCRKFYTSYLESPGLKEDILDRQIGDRLLPQAIALQLLSSSQAPEERHKILDTLYRNPSQLRDRLRDIPLTDTLQIGRRHSVIHDLIVGFSKSAWSLLSEEELVLSDDEYWRFGRAFYRFDMLCVLIRATTGDFDRFNVPQTPKIELLSRHAPWENEQIACVHDFLESILAEAMYDVLAHDVDFGEYSVDYLSRGGDASRTQQWLSAGLDFLRRIFSIESFDAKAALLHAQSSTFPTIPWDQLIPETDENADDDDGTVLANYSEAEWKQLRAQSSVKEYLEHWPWEAWRGAHADLPRNAFVMFSENSGLRDRAYVFWDNQRFARYCLLRKFEREAPPRVEILPESDEWTQMERSWEARSKIWQRGGRGYWAEGDLSRIEWPSGCPQDT